MTRVVSEVDLEKLAEDKDDNTHINNDPILGGQTSLWKEVLCARGESLHLVSCMCAR